jgi:hypothetical protein
MIHDPNIPGVGDIYEQVPLLMDITVESAWMEYRADRGLVGPEEIKEFARREQLLIILLKRLVETERMISFARETLDDLSSLP